MQLERIGVPFEVKFTGDPLAGQIEGYGSVFGNRDFHGDVIVPGAFRETLAARKARGSLPPMYMQHGAFLGADPRPVGVWTAMEEDERGLKVAGYLVGLDTETGRYNLAQIRDGAMRGLSIGYRVPKGGASYGDKPGEPRRRIKTIELHEVSVVDDPANHLAQIDSLKSASAGQIDDVASLAAAVDLLREAGGTLSSKKAANDFIGRVAKIARREAGDDRVTGLLEQLRSSRRLVSLSS